MPYSIIPCRSLSNGKWRTVHLARIYDPKAKHGRLVTIERAEAEEKFLEQWELLYQAQFRQQSECRGV